MAITLTLVKQHLRYEASDEDMIIEAYMAAARDWTVNYTGRIDAELDTPALDAAQLLMIGHWFEHREAASERTLTDVPLAVESLAHPYRKLAV